jgi:hypothetical protein
MMVSPVKKRFMGRAKPTLGGVSNAIAVRDWDLLIYAPWEGGNSPSSVSGEAQNLSLVSSDSVAMITDWSGNGKHASAHPSYSTQPTWDEEGYTSTGGVVYLLGGVVDAGVQIGDGSSKPKATIFAVIEDLGGTGTMFSAVNSSDSNSYPWMLDRSSGELALFTDGGTLSVDSSYSGKHIVEVVIDGDSNVQNCYLDGVFVDTDDIATQADDIFLQGLFARANGANRASDMKIIGLMMVNDVLSSSDRDAIRVQIGADINIPVTAGFAISYPQERNIYQKHTASDGPIYAHGTYDSTTVTALEARYGSSGSYTACTLNADGTWTVTLTGCSVGTDTFYIRTTDLSRTAEVSTVMVGNKIGAFGQSNIFGAAQNKFNLSSNMDIAIFDPRHEPMGLMAGSLPRNQWNPAYNKSIFPYLLEDLNTRDSEPWGVVRWAIGTTKIAWWEPDAAVDAAGYGYGVQYYTAFVNALIEANGLDPATYNEATHGKVCDAIILGIGETDAKTGTTQASWEASALEIANALNTKFDVKTYVGTISNLGDTTGSGYTTQARNDDIQDAQVASWTETNIEVGADMRTYNVTTDPVGDLVHYYTDGEIEDYKDTWYNLIP